MKRYSKKKLHATIKKATAANSRSTNDEPQFRPKSLPRREREATKRVAKKLDKRFSRTATEKQVDRDVAELKAGRRQNARRVRKIVGGIYPLYLHYVRHEDKRLMLYQACIEAGINLSTRMDLASVVVRYHLRNLSLKPEAISRYASVLRRAALDQILPDRLRDHLGTKGHSIKAMAATKLSHENHADKGKAPRKPQITLRCTEDLREKMERYRAGSGCWLHVKPKESGPPTVDKVSRHRPRSEESSSTQW
jgi:hypothetical protein